MILLIITLSVLVFGTWYWTWKINTWGVISQQKVLKDIPYLELSPFGGTIFTDRRDFYNQDAFKYMPYEPKFSIGIDPALPGDDISTITVLYPSPTPFKDLLVAKSKELELLRKKQAKKYLVDLERYRMFGILPGKELTGREYALMVAEPPKPDWYKTEYHGKHFIEAMDKMIKESGYEKCIKNL